MTSTTSSVGQAAANEGPYILMIQGLATLPASRMGATTAAFMATTMRSTLRAPALSAWPMRSVSTGSTATPSALGRKSTAAYHWLAAL